MAAGAMRFCVVRQFFFSIFKKRDDVYLLVLREKRAAGDGEHSLDGYLKSGAEVAKEELDKQLGYAWFANAWSSRIGGKPRFQKVC